MGFKNLKSVKKGDKMKRIFFIAITLMMVYGLTTSAYAAYNFTPLDYPNSTMTHAFSIDAENIVGEYWDLSGVHGFLYDGSTWTSLDYPGTTIGTHAYGISGSNIVGYYYDASGTHGFLYDGTNWTSLNYPGALYTYVTGISGGNIVGYYLDGNLGGHGFLYDGTNWIPLNYPGASSTSAYGIDGGGVVYITKAETLCLKIKS